MLFIAFSNFDYHFFSAFVLFLFAANLWQNRYDNAFRFKSEKNSVGNANDIDGYINHRKRNYRSFS